MNNFMMDASGQTTHITTWGVETNPTLVCLHGLGGTPLSFIEIAEALCHRYYVVAPTIPGSGGTAEFPSADHYQIPELVKWFKAVLDTLKIDHCFMLSHSWGAHIGLFFQNQYPQRLTKHLLLDGGYYQREPDNSLTVLEAEISEQIASDDDYCFDDVDTYLTAEEGDVNHWNERLVQAAMTRMIEKDGKLHWHLSHKFTAASFRGIFDSQPETIYSELFQKNLSDKLLLLRATEPKSYNERDKFEAAFRTQTGLPVERIDGAGHSIHLDKPDVVIARARSYFVND